MHKTKYGRSSSVSVSTLLGIGIQLQLSNIVLHFFCKLINRLFIILCRSLASKAGVPLLELVDNQI